MKRLHIRGQPIFQKRYLLSGFPIFRVLALANHVICANAKFMSSELFNEIIHPRSGEDLSNLFVFDDSINALLKAKLKGSQI